MKITKAIIHDIDEKSYYLIFVVDSEQEESFNYPYQAETIKTMIKEYVRSDNVIEESECYKILNEMRWNKKSEMVRTNIRNYDTLEFTDYYCTRDNKLFFEVRIDYISTFSY